MDHTDNLNQVNDDLMNVETNIEGIDNRVTAAEGNIVLLETAVEELDGRASDIEQILSGEKCESTSKICPIYVKLVNN